MSTEHFSHNSSFFLCNLVPAVNCNSLPFGCIIQRIWPEVFWSLCSCWQLFAKKQTEKIGTLKKKIQYTYKRREGQTRKPDNICCSGSRSLDKCTFGFLHMLRSNISPTKLWVKLEFTCLQPKWGLGSS